MAHSRSRTLSSRAPLREEQIVQGGFQGTRAERFSLNAPCAVFPTDDREKMEPASFRCVELDCVVLPGVLNQTNTFYLTPILATFQKQQMSDYGMLQPPSYTSLLWGTCRKLVHL